LDARAAAKELIAETSSDFLQAIEIF